MNVINITLDPTVLDPESVVAFRSRAYGELVSHYSLVAPSSAKITVKLSEKTTAYGVGGTFKAIKFFKIFFKVRSLIRSGLCTVITTPDMYFLGLIGVSLSRRYHLGFEVQVLGIEKLNLLRKQVALFVLNRAGVIRALSPRIRDRLIHEFHIDPARIVVTSIYVDVHKLGLGIRTLDPQTTQEYEEATKVFRDTYRNKFNFLAVSRLVPIKRIENQLAAVQALLPTIPNIMLHIVGHGPLEEQLKAAAQHLGITDHVVFHGYQTGYKLGLFYLECDAFILTSDYEGWGMVVIEAASAGLPIIMTDVGCARELIVDGKSGLIVPPKDVPALTEAMRRIATDQELRSKLSVGATQSLATLPSFEQLLKEYKANWERAYQHRI